MVVLTALRVMVSMKDGPHDGKLAGVTDRVAPAGVGTLFVTTIAPDTGGAHLKESVVLPWPVVCEKVMVIGFVVQITFGGDEEEDVAETYDVARMEPMMTASTML